MYTVLPDGTAAIIYLKALDVRPEVISFRCRWKVETLIATRKERGSGEKKTKNGIRLNCSAGTSARAVGGSENERESTRVPRRNERSGKCCSSLALLLWKASRRG